MERREKGTGSVYQRPNGSWTGRVELGRGLNGKRNFKFFTGETEGEVKRKIREYQKSNVSKDSEKVLFGIYLSDWLENIKHGQIKDSSYDRLESTASKHVKPYLGDFYLTEIKPKDISMMMTGMKKSGLSYSSIKKAYDCVNAVLQYAFLNRDISSNPAALVSSFIWAAKQSFPAVCS